MQLFGTISRKRTLPHFQGSSLDQRHKLPPWFLQQAFQKHYNDFELNWISLIFLLEILVDLVLNQICVLQRRCFDTIKCRMFDGGRKKKNNVTPHILFPKRLWGCLEKKGSPIQKIIMNKTLQSELNQQRPAYADFLSLLQFKNNTEYYISHNAPG